MILQPNADLAKAAQRDLIQTMAALPQHDQFRDAIRIEVATRTLRHMTEQRVAKHRAAQIRSRARLDRTSLAKAAMVDFSKAPDDELVDLAVNTDDPDKRSAVLMEIGRRSMVGKWKPTAKLASSPSKPAPAKVVQVPVEDVDPAQVDPNVTPGQPMAKRYHRQFGY